MNYIITDWIGKRVYADKTFESYQDARDYIERQADNYATDENGIVDEDKRQGFVEELYAEEATI